MKRTLTLTNVLILALALLLGCESAQTSDAGGDADAGLDTTRDAPLDNEPPLDSKPDVTVDAGSDTGPRAWETAVVDDSPKLKQRSVVRIGSDGVPQLAYNIATEPEGWFVPSVWFAEANANSFDRTEVVAANNVSRNFPNMIIDQKQRTHIFYSNVVDGFYDIHHVWTDDRETFSEPLNITNTTALKDYFPMLAVGPDNVIHLLYHREHTQNSAETTLAYLRLSEGKLSEVEEVATQVSEFALNPDYAMSVAGDGTVYAVYSRPGQSNETNVLWLRKRDGSGQWGDERRLTSEDQEAWGPAIDIEANGAAHIVYVIGGAGKTLTHLTITGEEVGEPKALTSSSSDRSYHLGLLVEPAGRLHIAFSRIIDKTNNADIFYLSGNDGVFLPEQRITETPEGDELHPGVALGNDGEVYISFVESLSKGPDGEVFLSTGRCE